MSSFTLNMSPELSNEQNRLAFEIALKGMRAIQQAKVEGKAPAAFIAELQADCPAFMQIKAGEPQPDQTEIEALAKMLHAYEPAGAGIDEEGDLTFTHFIMPHPIAPELYYKAFDLLNKITNGAK